MIARASGGGRDGRPPHPRGAGRLLLDQTVGPYIAAKAAAAIGVWIHNVVAAVVVFELTRSVTLVGAISVAQFTPQIVLSPMFGALADRGNRRVMAVFGKALSALGSGGLAAWLLLAPPGAGGPWPFIAASLVVGIGFAVSVPATHALVPSLAEPEELAALIAVDTAPFTLARAIGPALGALMLTQAGPAVAFAVAATTHAVLASTVALVRLRPKARTPSTDRSATAAIRHLRVDPVVGLLLVAVVAIGLGVDPVVTLTPPLAAHFGYGAGLVAAMASAFGLGAASTPFLVGSVHRRLGVTRTGGLGVGILTASLFALAASPMAAAALVVLFVGGCGMMLGVTSLTTQLQQRIPENLRGRIMALWGIAFVGSRPLAAALNGIVADRYSARVALVVLGVVLTLLAIVARPARLRALDRDLA